jgi:adenine-specific DNA-methyltransferase
MATWLFVPCLFDCSIRTANVKRTFGNKTTWERPFPELLQKYALEYSAAVFSNGQKNRVIGGYDALVAPNGVDLVYLDPPYFSSHASQGTSYLAFYHFLEGLADYEHWAERINGTEARTRRMSDSRDIQAFIKRSGVKLSFEKLLERFQDNTIVLSYQDEGIPSKREILKMLRSLGKRVKVFEKPHRYALSSRSNTELLFIAT